jgi:hypothetical protein
MSEVKGDHKTDKIKKGTDKPKPKVIKPKN